MAVQNARTICFVEIEAFCCEVLVARMEEGSLDKAPIFSDIKTFDGNPWRGTVDCIIGGFPCFAEGTLILTDRGYVPIESVSSWDSVLTHLGHWKRVTSTMSREDAPLRLIRGQGIPNLITTDEHPFYSRTATREWFNNTKTYKRIFGKPQWVESRNIANTYVGQVLPAVGKDGHSADFWWLIGRYLADGWMVDRKTRGRGTRNTLPPSGRVVICCAKEETETVNSRIRLAGFNISPSQERTVTKFHITDTRLYKFVQQFGRYAHGKRIPRIALELDKARAKALIDGYFSGDGHREKRNKEIRATTVSKSLALGIALLAQRAYGVVASVREQRVKPKTIIEGRIVNQRTQYIISIPDRNRSAFVENEYGWKLIRESEPIGTGRVYNISVEEDESYIAEGAIVHNCQPFSVSGKRGGVDDPRHLWPHIARVVQETQPEWCFFENVPGLLSTRTPDGGYAYQIVEHDLHEMGYEVEAGLFSAEEVGAPHRRIRLFIMAHNNNPRIRTPRSKLDKERQTENKRQVHIAFDESARFIEELGKPQRTGLERGILLQRPKESNERHIGLADTKQSELQVSSSAETDNKGRGVATSTIGELAVPVCVGRGGRNIRLLKAADREQPENKTEGRCSKLVDTEHTSTTRLREHSRQGRETPEGTSRPISQLDDTDSKRRKGWERDTTKRSYKRLAWRPSKPFPPKPNDRDEWGSVIEETPYLSPAIEYPVRGMVDELAYGLDKPAFAFRKDRLRAVGNGVVPLTAALAFTVLYARLVGLKNVSDAQSSR